jgi:hypothetical protein
MIVLIQPSDFEIGIYSIPNAVSVNAGEGVNAELQEFINESTQDLLLSALGKTQFAEFDAITSIGIADQKWQDFVDGKGTYKGIKSVLKPYIYSGWLAHDNVKYTSAGGSKSSTRGSNVASLVSKHVDAYNKFVDRYHGGDIVRYWSYNRMIASNRDSLYQFMSENDISVDDFIPFEYINRYGLC